MLNAVSGAVGHVFRTLLSLLSGVQSWAAVSVSAIELYLDIRSTIEDYVRVGNRLRFLSPLYMYNLASVCNYSYYFLLQGFTEPTSDKLLPDLLLVKFICKFKFEL